MANAHEVGMRQLIFLLLNLGFQFTFNSRISQFHQPKKQLTNIVTTFYKDAFFLPQQQQQQLGWVTGFVEAIASLNDLGVRLSTAVGRLKDDSSALLQESVERRETSASGDQSSEPNTIGSNPNDKNSESGIPEGEEQVNENMEKLTLSEVKKIK